MKCKNCYTNLAEEDQFCSKCGAKVIKERLNLKMVFQEFTATFISWDNTILKTFKHLITQPEKVINTYINGTRKRYLKPFTFLLIALSIYGIYLNVFGHLYLETFSKWSNFNNENIKLDKDYIERMQKITSIIFKYFNLIQLILIPFYAFILKKVFKRNNFVEHIIIISYVEAELFIISTVLLTIMILLKVNIIVATNILSPFSYIYFFYVYKRVYQLSFIDTLVKFLILLLYFIGFVAVISISFGLLLGVYKILIR